MATIERKVDDKARVTLPSSFAGKPVLIETVSESEVRVRVIRVPRPVPSLKQLLAGVTEENRHEAVDFGPPVGEELL